MYYYEIGYSGWDENQHSTYSHVIKYSRDKLAELVAPVILKIMEEHQMLYAKDVLPMLELKEELFKLGFIEFTTDEMFIFDEFDRAPQIEVYQKDYNGKENKKIPLFP